MLRGHGHVPAAPSKAPVSVSQCRGWVGVGGQNGLGTERMGRGVCVETGRV